MKKQTIMKGDGRDKKKQKKCSRVRLKVMLELTLPSDSVMTVLTTPLSQMNTDSRAVTINMCLFGVRPMKRHGHLHILRDVCTSNFRERACIEHQQK